jgi:hypothetical protein
MSTCNWLDLQTLGSQPIMPPKNLPDHYIVLPPFQNKKLRFIKYVGLRSFLVLLAQKCERYIAH